MTSKFSAAGLAACLLSACGFVPPKPPTPPDSARIPINHGPPLLARAGTAGEGTPSIDLTALAQRIDSLTEKLEAWQHQSPSTTEIAAQPAALVDGSDAGQAAPASDLPPAPATPLSTSAGLPEADATHPGTKPTAVAPLTVAPLEAIPTVEVATGPDAGQADDAAEIRADHEPPTDAPELDQSAGAIDTPAPGEEVAPVEIAAPEPLLPSWHAEPGQRLSEVIDGWAQREGWTVRRETDLDYPIEAPLELTAPTFVDAAEQAFGLYRNASRRFAPAAYTNQVLLVREAK